MRNTMRALCNMCPWKSYVLPESTAKELATYHVAKRHPETYTEITGKPVPELTGKQEFDLLVWTDAVAVKDKD